MRHPIVLTLAGILLILSRTSLAGCTAPEDENQTPCVSCGNLEQNVQRAHDLAWNEFLQNQLMRLQLRVNGATLVHLTNPPHSSPGVLYYTVLIEDPDFEIINVASHAEAVQLLRSWGVGISASTTRMHAEWLYRQQLSTRIEEILSTSVSTGSSPYIMRLLDSKGNLVEGGTIEQPRLAGEQQEALAGPSDLHPDDQYANEHCASEDPRQEGGGTADTGTNGGGDWSDNGDSWEGWGNGLGDLRPLCRPDFSDPAGAGVICVI